ncbi:MAG: cadherin-like domain-containing protein, partial [Methyloligellaceae bacterium]
SLVNLVAAYAHDAGIKAARDAGDLDLARALADTAMTDQTFMEGTPTYDPGTGTWTVSGGDQGFWDIDLWVGGLAERPLIDGILGTTFSFVFLDFAQRMQDGDRFYYLFRLPPGTSIGQQVIATKFSEIVSRNTGADNLNGDAFAYADRYFTTDPADPSSQYFTADPSGTNFFFNGSTALLDDADPTSIAAGGHIVVVGGAGNDHLTAGDGDDTVHGNDGNDYINGSQGNDHLFGGAGNDFIIDDENDDFIDGGTGADIIFAGKGALDTVFGGEGNDEIHGGDGIDELFGGEGDDTLFGDGDTDVMVGGLGNDYMDGGDSVDEMWGGEGNDIMLGGVGDDHLNGDGGNDLLFGGLGAAANDGDRLLGDALINQFGVFPPQEGTPQDAPGFDIGSYEFVGIGITADLQTSNENGTGSNLIDTYAFIDGLVGSQFDDDLTGAGADTTTTNGVENLLVGGGGNDVLTVLGGDDYIAGDSVVVDNDLQVAADQDESAAFVDAHGLNRIDLLDGKGLGHVLGATGAAGDADVAVFRGDFADYTVSDNGNGTVQVADDRDADATPDHDGTDTLKGIEVLRFDDGDRTVRQVLNRAPVATGPALLSDLLVNTSVTIALMDLLQNVSDPDGDTLSVVNLAASSGTLVDNGNDTWTFTPDPDDTTEVTFTYDVSDGLASVPQTASLDLVPIPGNDIVGTEGPDMLLGTIGNDMIDALGGDDVVFARAGNDIVDGGEGMDRILAGAGDDIVFGGDGADTIFGGAGNDTIFADEGADMVFGGGGNDFVDGGTGADMIYGQAGNDILDGGAGIDTIRGGSGNDTIIGGLGTDDVNGNSGDDQILATMGDGNDVYRGGSGVDTYDLSGTTAAADVDLAARTASSAQTGNDQIRGFENAVGSFGDDTIAASDAVNVLAGGAGNDTFVFRSVDEAGTSAAARDQISDFEVGDLIDLSGIDADTVDGGNQSFELILDKPAFTEAGQLMFRHETQADGDHTIVEGNVDGDLAADFQIDIVGRHDLRDSDFIGLA